MFGVVVEAAFTNGTGTMGGGIWVAVHNVGVRKVNLNVLVSVDDVGFGCSKLSLLEEMKWSHWVLYPEIVRTAVFIPKSCAHR